MEKKLTKKETEGLLWLLGIFLIIGFLIKFIELIEPFFLIILIGLGYWHYDKKKKERFAYLLDKYKDEEIVNNILNKIIWQGKTEDQILESLGKPIDIESKILKNKEKRNLEI